MRPRSALLAWMLAACVVACAGTGSQGEPRSKRNSEDPDDSAARLQVKLGRGYLEQGELETAHGKLERAIQLDPKSVDAHTLMGVLYDRLKRPKFAEKHYRRAVELDPEDGSTNNNLGSFLCQNGDYAEADTHFRRALEDPFYKTPAAAMSNAGICAARGGDNGKAESYFRKSLDANPNDADTLYQMAQLSFRLSNYLRARGFIQRYESVTKAEASALDLAAQIEERLGDTAAAAKYRERLKTEFPDYEPDTDTKGSNSP